MIVGRDEEVDGHFVATRFVAFVLPRGACYVAGEARIPIRSSTRSTILATARVWLPILAVGWPIVFGPSLGAWIGSAMFAAAALAAFRRVDLPDGEKRMLRLLGSQTGLRIDPSRLLPETRRTKLEMLESLMTKGGLTADPEWLVSVLHEIPAPALPLVYAYARYASDAPPWSACADRILAQIDAMEL